MDVTLIETGVANTASIRAALARAGAEVRFTTNPGEVSGAARVVLPGVGHFAAGAARLRDLGLDTVLRERIEAGRPTLAICLGLQLLCEGSAEAPGVPGIGAVPQVVRPLTGRVLPQLGWNQVRPEPGLGFSEPGSAYFANSFALDRAPAGWRACWSTYGQPFIAAIEREGVLALSLIHI